MLSMFANNYISGRNSIWNQWLQCIMGKSKLVLTEAVLLRENGERAAGSKGFEISKTDFKWIEACFQDRTRQTLMFHGVTYCIKSCIDTQVVAFNGGTYIIINKTKCMYIVAICKSRKMSSPAADWIGKIADKLRSKQC